MKQIFILMAVATLFLASCSTSMRTIREPNQYVEFQKDDFNYSAQVTAEATSTKIVGIDFARLFSKELAFRNMPFTIPVVGNYVSDYTANYALYKLLQENEGYDAVFYPQYNTTVQKPFGIGLYTITTSKVTARLGKLK